MVSGQKNVKRLTKYTLFTASLKYSKAVFYMIRAVTKPEILIDLFKVPPYTEVIHQLHLLFKCTRPSWVSGDVGCKTQNWQPNVHILVYCHGLGTPHAPLHQAPLRGRLPIVHTDVWWAVLLVPCDGPHKLCTLATGAYAYIVQLPHMHPQLYTDFLNGIFVVQKSGRKFSLIGKDQSREQSNKNLQAHGGAVGLYENHEALTLFMLAVRDCTRCIKEVWGCPWHNIKCCSSWRDKCFANQVL
jgi:hypothetical protein